MPVSGVIPDNAASTVPPPLSLPTSPASLKPGSSSTFRSFSTLSSGTLPSTTTTGGAHSTPIRSASSSKIYSSTSSTSHTNTNNTNSAPFQSRATKPPTPITPTDTSLRNHVFGIQQTLQSSSAASGGSTTAPPNNAQANASSSSQPAGGSSSAEYGKAKPSVRDVGAGPSTTLASPRPKVYPTSMSRGGTPSKPSVQLGLTSTPAAAKPARPLKTTSSSSSQASQASSSSSSSRPNGHSHTAAPKASSSTGSRTSRGLRKTQSGGSDANGETDTSRYMTPPSSPDIDTPQATAASSFSVKNGHTVPTGRIGEPSRDATVVGSDGDGNTRASSDPTPTGTSASTNGTNRTPPSGTGAEDGELAFIAALRGRTECEILRAFAMPDRDVQWLKELVYGGNPALLRSLSPAEIDMHKRALALYDFYWFTRELDVNTMTAFANKVTFSQIRSIAAHEGYDTEADDEAFPVALKVDGVPVVTSNVVPPIVVDPTDVDESADDCPTPPNETRVDPRAAFFDSKTRHLRRMGRRCASGAALLAAAKRALREQEQDRGSDDGDSV